MSERLRLGARVRRSLLGRCAVLTLGAACAPQAAPRVSIQSPASGDRVVGSVALVAVAEPAAETAQVEFIVDSTSVGVATSPPFSLEWDSSSFAGRQVRVTARARGRSGAVSVSSAVSVAVDAPATPLPFGEESMYALVNLGVLKEAQELLQDVWDLGPRTTPVLIKPVTWTEDPFHDKYWRLLFYSMRPTVNLLWAYYTTGETSYRDKLLEILSSYVANDRTRPLDTDTFDENYASAFRGMILVNTYTKLKRSGDLSPALDADLLSSINKIGAFIASPGGYTGNFGNHGFTSAASLLLIATNFPELTEAPDWNRIGFERLNQLIVNAVDVDGVEVENAPFYHLYVLTFAEQIATWANQWGVKLPPEFVARADLMSGYAAYILRPDGTVPLLSATVATGLSQLDPTVEAAVTARDSDFAYVASRGASGTAPVLRSRLFPQSGQSLLRSSFGTAEDFGQQTYATFNVGPWRNAHNHLDVLSLTYFASGRSLVTDSGLFSYDPGPEHDYFYGTSGHNTVVVDGHDQSQTQVVTEGLTAEGPAWAYQSGSHGLYAGVTHARGVLLLQRDLLLVVDHLSSTDTHAYAQTWHLMPDLSVSGDGASLDALDATGAPVLSVVQGLGAGVELATLSGETDPIQGWYSERYGIKVPSPALEFRETGGNASFVTLLASGSFAGTAPQVHVDHDGAQIHLRVCAGSVQDAIEIDDLAGTAEAVSVTPAQGCP